MPVYPVKSVVRTIELLELFREVRQPLRLSSISKHLGWPLPSTMSVLKSLVQLGYLQFNRQMRTYFPSPGLATLGDWIPNAWYGDYPIPDLMAELAARTAENVLLSGPNDLNLQYHKVMIGPKLEKAACKAGDMRPLVQSSAGLMLLSMATETTVERIGRQSNIRFRAKQKPVSIDRLLRDVERIRVLGYSYLRGMPCANRATVSMLLPATATSMPLAITIAGREDRIAQNEGKLLKTMTDVLRTYQDMHRQIA